MHPALFLIAILPSVEVWLASYRPAGIRAKCVSLIKRLALMRGRALSVRRFMSTECEGRSK